MNKKVYMILGGILVLIVLTISAIVFLSKKNNALTTTAGSGQQTGTSPSPSSAALSPTSQTPTPAPVSSPHGAGANKISDGPVVSPAFSYDNKAIWYFSPDGHLYKQNLTSGLKQEYVLPTLLSVNNIIWPSTGNDFIVETDSPLGKQFNYYSSKAKSFIPYPSNVKEVDFMQDGVHVIYQWLEANGTSTISTANADLSGHVKVATLNDTDDIIKAAPNNNKAFAFKNNAPSNGTLYYINLDNQKVYSLKTAAANSGLWSPSGQKFIFDKLGPDGDRTSTQLWLGDLANKNDIPLGINTTTAKVAFDSSGQNIYLAVPQQDGSGDAFWKMNLATKIKKQFYTPKGSTTIDSSNLIVSQDGATVYFRNIDGYLYSLPTGN